LRGVVIEQNEEIQELKNLFWSIIRGLVGDDYSPEMLYSVLLIRIENSKRGCREIDSPLLKSERLFGSVG